MNRCKPVIIMMVSLLFVSCVHLSSPEPSIITTSLANPVQRSESEQGLLAVRFLGLHELGEKNGESNLIITPNGRTVLIDAGRKKDYAQLRDIFSEAGIDTLDYLIFTHFHDDHIGDFQQLSKEFSIGKVFLVDFPGLQGQSAENSAEIMSVLAGKQIPYGFMKSGDFLDVDAEVRISCLSPDSPVSYDSTVVDERTATIFENQHSLVVQLSYINHTFLFTGDIYKDMEFSLIKRYGSSLHSDVLKVPHHGLSTSSSTAFILEVNPSLSVVPSGEPTESTLNSLRFYNRTLTTVSYGTILVLSDGTQLRIITEHDDVTRGIYGE